MSPARATLTAPFFGNNVEHVKSVAEAFDKYLGDEKVRKHKMWITKEECIKLIINAGGKRKWKIMN